MMGSLIRLINPENFTEEVLSALQPVLLLCMPCDDDFPSQLKSMEVIARNHRSWLKTGLLSDGFIESFKKNLNVAGTPTFLIFVNGKEKNRMMGLADHNELEGFILVSLE